MRGRFLHVSKRNPGVQGGGDERVPQGVRSDRFGDPGADRDSADDPGGAVPVQSLSVRGEEDRPFHAFANGQVDRPCRAGRERDGDDLAALAGDDKRPVTALDTQVLDVGAGGLGNPQPVEGQQGDQGVLGGWAQPAATSSAPSSLRSSPTAWDS